MTYVKNKLKKRTKKKVKKKEVERGEGGGGAGEEGVGRGGRENTLMHQWQIMISKCPRSLMLGPLCLFWGSTGGTGQLRSLHPGS